RQQADHVAVEAAREKQEPFLPGLRRDVLRRLAGTLNELDRAHRPQAPGLADRRLMLGELLEPAPYEAADRLGALAEAGLDERAEHGARGRAGDGIPAERAAETAGMHRVHDLRATSDARQRQPAAERLAGDDQGGLDVEGLHPPDS